MTDPGFIKCPCRHCGGRIEFPTQAIGMTVDCPHCGQRTLLGRAQSTIQAPAAPRAKPAPEVTEPADSSRRFSLPHRRLLVVAVAGLAVLGAGAWWWLQREQAPSGPPPQPASLPGKMAAMEAASRPAPPTPPPGTAKPKSLDDLKAGPVTLEKARSGSLVYATGTIRNDSEHQRFGVRVEIRLADADGRVLRPATDYTAVIEPRQEWRFRGLVMEAKAVSGQIASIKEEP